MKKTIVVLVALALVLSSAFAQAAAESQTILPVGGRHDEPFNNEEGRQRAFL